MEATQKAIDTLRTSYFYSNLRIKKGTTNTILCDLTQHYHSLRIIINENKVESSEVIAKGSYGNSRVHIEKHNTALRLLQAAGFEVKLELFKTWYTKKEGTIYP